MPVRITDIGGAEGFFRKGDLITAIDGRKVEDQLDLYFLLSGADSVVFELERENGSKVERRIRLETFERAAPVFERMRFIGCRSRCIFCFVDQMPPGMRDSLYFKDDDYRLSFLFGNYITLNDISGRQIKRIMEYNLSPLYVSVHATDERVRRKIFGRGMKRKIMSVLSELAGGGITIHAQVVVIPGVNDGKVLKDTIRRLFTLYPACRTLAVVPVGLTAHRNGLYPLRKVNEREARETIDLAGRMNDLFREKTGETDFVQMSDEYYILAGRVFPRAERYGGFEQLSNGVGMCRLFIEETRERLEELGKRWTPPSGEMTIVTGRLGGRFLGKHILPMIGKKLPGLETRIVTAGNSTFGRTVTVSGLLGAADISAAVRRAGSTGGALVIPPNTVNHDGMMIDDVTPDQLGAELGLEVIVPESSFLEDGVLEKLGRRQG